MKIIDSGILVFILLNVIIVALLLFSFYKITDKKKRITFLTVGIVSLYPIPLLLLKERMMNSIGYLSYSKLLDHYEQGLSSTIILNRYYILGITVICVIYSLYLNKGKFKLIHISDYKLLFLVMFLSIGFDIASLSIGLVLQFFTFIVILLVGKVDFNIYKYFSYYIFIVYIIGSYLLILVAPELAVFEDGSWMGVFLNPNSATLVLNFILAISIISYKTNKKYYNKYISISIAILCLIYVYMSGSRNSLLLSILIVMVNLIGQYAAKKFFIYILTSSIILVIFIMVLASASIDVNKITSTRYQIWATIFENVNDPLEVLFGVGKSFFSLENKNVVFDKNLQYVSNSFSSYIDQYVYNGLVGLFLFLYMLSKFYSKIKNKYMGAIFFILIIMPNLFESFFTLPFFSINSAIYILIFFYSKKDI